MLVIYFLHRLVVMLDLHLNVKHKCVKKCFLYPIWLCIDTSGKATSWERQHVNDVWKLFFFKFRNFLLHFLIALFRFLHNCSWNGNTAVVTPTTTTSQKFAHPWTITALRTEQNSMHWKVCFLQLLCIIWRNVSVTMQRPVVFRHFSSLFSNPGLSYFVPEVGDRWLLGSEWSRMCWGHIGGIWANNGEVNQRRPLFNYLDTRQQAGQRQQPVQPLNAGGLCKTQTH